MEEHLLTEARKDLLLRILRDARNLIRKGWTQNVLARTASGYPIGPNKPPAAKFCALGACERAAHDIGDVKGFERAMIAARLKAALPAGFYWPTDFNDNHARTQREVVDWFTRAIVDTKALEVGTYLAS